MSDHLTIAAKNLGNLAMANSCDRCFWIRTHFNGEFPYSIFARIFNTIDRATKLAVSTYFDDKGKLPAWLAPLGDVVGYIEPPHYSEFVAPVTENVTIRGEADAIFKRRDGKLVIADYKTATFQGIDDTLLPIYQTQLGGYSWIAKHLGMPEVAEIALVYMEPCGGPASARLDANRRADGFALGFRCQTMSLPVDLTSVKTLAEKAWEIHSLMAPPPSREGCKNCAATRQLIELNSMRTSSQAAFAKLIGAA